MHPENRVHFEDCFKGMGLLLFFVRVGKGEWSCVWLGVGFKALI